MTKTVRTSLRAKRSNLKPLRNPTVEIVARIRTIERIGSSSLKRSEGYLGFQVHAGRKRKVRNFVRSVTVFTGGVKKKGITAISSCHPASLLGHTNTNGLAIRLWARTSSIRLDLSLPRAYNHFYGYQIKMPMRDKWRINSCRQ
jgi:hypothetical protein